MNALPVALLIPGDMEAPGALVEVDLSRELGAVLLETDHIVVRALDRIRVLDVRRVDGTDAKTALASAVRVFLDVAAARAADQADAVDLSCVGSAYPHETEADKVECPECHPELVAAEIGS